MFYDFQELIHIFGGVTGQNRTTFLVSTLDLALNPALVPTLDLTLHPTPLPTQKYRVAWMLWHW
jgi:hypothetical protein